MRHVAASAGGADPHQQLLALASLENRDLNLVFISLQILIDPHLTLHTHKAQGRRVIKEPARAAWTLLTKKHSSLTRIVLKSNHIKKWKNRGKVQLNACTLSRMAPPELRPVRACSHQVPESPWDVHTGKGITVTSAWFWHFTVTASFSCHTKVRKRTLPGSQLPRNWLCILCGTDANKNNCTREAKSWEKLLINKLSR